MTKAVIAVALVIAFVIGAVVLVKYKSSDPATSPSWTNGLPWSKAAPRSTTQPSSTPALLTQSEAKLPALVPSPVPTASQALLSLQDVSRHAQEFPTRQPPATVVARAAPQVAPPPSGNNPQSALDAGGGIRVLGAGATVWYRIGTAAKTGVNMDVWLDATPSDNVEMAIFAPNQMSNLDGNPVGHGTRSGTDPRLHWTGGGSNAIAGSWYARITNKNSSPIKYVLTSAQTQIAPKSCESYWEYIGSDRVYWTACK